MEPRALPGFGIHADRTVEFLDDHLRNGQPEPSSGCEIVEFDEPVENIARLLGRYAHAGILDEELHAPVLQVESEADLPLFGKLAGVVQQVGNDLCQAVLVADDLHVRDPFLEDQLHARLDAGFVDFQLRAAEVVEVHRPEAEFERPGFDLRNVEDIVYQLQQQLGIDVDDIDELLFLLLGFHFADELGKAHDGIERRADLVAHVRQEGRFETVGLLDDLQLGILHVGDVPRDTDDERKTVFDRHQRLGSIDDTGLARDRDVLLDEGLAFARTQQRQVVLAEMLRILRAGENLVIGMPERPGGRNPRIFLERPVPVEVTELVARVFHEQIDRDIVEDALQDGVHLLDLALVFDALRHVPAEEPDNLAFLEVVVDDVGHDVPRHDMPLLVLEADGVFVRAVIAAYFLQPGIPLLTGTFVRPEIVNLVLRKVAFDIVPHPELFVGIFHRTVQAAGVDLLVDIVQCIFDHLQFMLGSFGLGDVTADAEGMLPVERENTVFVVAGSAVERNVVVGRRAAPRRKNIVEVVLHIAAGRRRKHRADVLPGELSARNPDMVGLIRGNQFDQRPVAIEHGQHVGYRIENLTGITLPEPAPGTLRRIELCFELFDPAEKLLTGTVIVSAHTL